MKIALDMQAAQSESRDRGIGRYSLALAKAIVRNAAEHDVLVCLNQVFPETIEPLREIFSELLPAENILVYRSLPRAMSRDPANNWRNRAGQLIRESWFASLDVDVVHAFSLFEGWGDDSVVSSGCLPARHLSSATVYDLIPHMQPDRYLPAPDQKRWYADQLASLQRCDLLLAISEYTQKTTIDLLGVAEDNIHCVFAGADDMFSPVDKSDPEYGGRLHDLGVHSPFIMYTGVIGREEPRKNFPGLLRAYAHLSPELQQKYQLVLVGRYNSYIHHDMQEEASSLGVDPDQLVFTGQIADADLILLYSCCDLFVFPSLEEGFGLPALEAIRCGAVVIGSNCSSIPEVIGNPDALFDPADSEDIARAIERALTDDAVRDAIYASGVEQARKFSWDRSARLALESFEQALARRNAQTEERVFSKLSITDRLDSLVHALGEIGTADVAQQDLVYCAQALAENHPQAERRQFFLDVSVLIKLDEKTGIQRVVRSLLNELSRDKPEFTDVRLVYLDAHGDFRVARYEVDAPDTLQRRADDTLADVMPGDVYLSLDLDLGGVDNPVRTDYLRYHRQRGLKIYYIVYDLLPILHGEFFHIGVKQRFPVWLEYVASEADGLLCISRTVADEVLDWLMTCPPQRRSALKLGYFHLGADIDASAPSRGRIENADATMQQFRDRPSILMVGTIEPRKGQQQALDAFDQLWAAGVEINLVLVGKSGWAMESFERRLNRHPQLDKQLFWLQSVSDEMLQEVYGACDVLLAASAGEGFGLPLIEAAKNGLPILARDLPVFREVAGDCAIYFEGTGAADLRAGIEHWLSLFNRGDMPDARQIPWLNWRESAGQIQTLALQDEGWYSAWQPAESYNNVLQS